MPPHARLVSHHAKRLARVGDDKPKRKKKSKAAEEVDRQDGRAGPKSENVVLQKSTFFSVYNSFSSLPFATSDHLMLLLCYLPCFLAD